MTLRLRRCVMDARDWCDDKRDEARQNDEGRHRRERWWKMDCDGAGRIKFCMANEDANEIGRRWVRDARLGQGSSSKERGGGLIFAAFEPCLLLLLLRDVSYA